VTDGAWMGDGRPQAEPGDITRGCVLFRWTCGAVALVLLAALTA